MTHWAHLNFFPDPFIQLNMEILNHPILGEMLSGHPAHEWEIRLAQIAQYCEVVLDGCYMPEDIENICTILVKRLVAKRVDNRSTLIIETRQLPKQ